MPQRVLSPTSDEVPQEIWYVSKLSRSSGRSHATQIPGHKGVGAVERDDPPRNDAFSDEEENNDEEQGRDILKESQAPTG